MIGGLDPALKAVGTVYQQIYKQYQLQKSVCTCHPMERVGGGGKSGLEYRLLLITRLL